jgi:hypothetical protein
MEEKELDLNGISIPQDEEIHVLPVYFMHEGTFKFAMGERRAYKNCFLWDS